MGKKFMEMCLLEEKVGNDNCAHGERLRKASGKPVGSFGNGISPAKLSRNKELNQSMSVGCTMLVV